MPISLCSGELYRIDKELVTREDMFCFFLDGHFDDFIMLYENCGGREEYYGIVSYKSLLAGKDIEEAVIREILSIEDVGFWEKANQLLIKDENKVIPVFDKNMNMIYFAQIDSRLSAVWDKLCQLQTFVDADLLKKMKHYKKYIHINGMNSVLWYLREWLNTMDTAVSVEGEAWSFFGIEPAACKNDGAVIVDEDCHLVEALYSDYWCLLDKKSTKLEELLSESYHPDYEKKESIAFYLTYYSYFMESVSSLIFRYLESQKECIVFVYPISWIKKVGPKNIEGMLGIVEKLKAKGAYCCCFDRAGDWIYRKMFDICFFCSEYSGRVPELLRKASKFVVSLQVTSIYGHMYRKADTFENVFSEQMRAETDYMIASDYMADWICKRDVRWNDKILRFGYPKLDMLYKSLKNKSCVPSEWLEKSYGKKVFLFTTIRMESSWLEYFQASDNILIIWRPHPGLFADISKRKKIEAIGKKYDIIIDNTMSYNAAFCLSDAMIAEGVSSIVVNYLYTDKPSCIYDSDDVYERNCVEDYRSEDWYNSAYIVFEGNSGKGVVDFMKMIERGENKDMEEKMMYRKRVVKNFDGEVCNRIYHFFEEKLH